MQHSILMSESINERGWERQGAASAAARSPSPACVFGHMTDRLRLGQVKGAADHFGSSSSASLSSRVTDSTVVGGGGVTLKFTPNSNSREAAAKLMRRCLRPSRKARIASGPIAASAIRATMKLIK